MRSPRTNIDSLFYSFRFSQRCTSIDHFDETHHHSTRHETAYARKRKHIQGQHNSTYPHKTQSGSRKIPQREQYPHTAIQDQQAGTAIAAVKQDISAGTAISGCQQQEPQLAAVTQPQQQEPHFAAAIHKHTNRNRIMRPTYKGTQTGTAFSGCHWQELHSAAVTIGTSAGTAIVDPAINPLAGTANRGCYTNHTSRNCNAAASQS